MALKQTLTLVSNFNTEVFFQDCYIKVLSVNGTKISVQTTYAIFDKKDGAILESRNSNFVPDMDGGNFIKQAYEHLKTFPEFEKATDV